MMDNVVDIKQGTGTSEVPEEQTEAKPNGHDPDGAAVAKKEEAAKEKRRASLKEHEAQTKSKEMETIICRSLDQI